MNVLLKTIFVSVLVFLLSWIGITPAYAVIDCEPSDISKLGVFVPPLQDRTEPSNIRVFGIPAEFEGQELHFFFQAPGADLPITYSFAATVPPGGDLNLQDRTIQELLPTMPVGNFTFTLRGGPITQTNPDGSFSTIYPICSDAEYSVEVIGGEDCFEGGVIHVTQMRLTHCCATTTCFVTQPNLHPDIDYRIFCQLS